MNIQRKNSAHHFRMQSEREQTLVYIHVCEILLEQPNVAINSNHWVRTRNIFSLKQFYLLFIGEQDQSPLYNSSCSIHIPSTQNITPLSNRLLV